MSMTVYCTVLTYAGSCLDHILNLMLHMYILWGICTQHDVYINVYIHSTCISLVPRSLWIIERREREKGGRENEEEAEKGGREDEEKDLMTLSTCFLGT